MEDSRGVLPKLPGDFDPSTINVVRGSTANAFLGALRKLDEKDGLDSSQPHPYWDQFETWPAVIVGLNQVGGDESGYNPGSIVPAMYWVRKQYIGAGLTADAPNFYNAQDDPTQWYPATNVLEMLSGTNAVQIGQPVLIMAYIDRGVTNRFRYLFIADRPVAWIKITSPQPYTSGGSYSGGGGYYNSSLVTGAPVKNDPTTNLIAPISPNETVGPANAILAVNWAEANLGDPASHWVPCNSNDGQVQDPFVPAWFIGYSNEETPRPVYRFYYPKPGLEVMQIVGNVHASTPSNGRYTAYILSGNVSIPDPAVTFTAWNQPEPGTAVQTSGGTYVYWCNTFEGGPNNGASSPTQGVVYGTEADPSGGSGRWVTGTFKGMTTNGYPVYYGDTSPSQTTFAGFALVVSGTGGDYETRPSFIYDVGPFDPTNSGVTAGIWASGVAPYVGRDNHADAPNGPMAAGYGPCLCYIDDYGQIQLWDAYEYPTGITEAVTIVDATPTTFDFQYIDGRVATLTES